MSDIKRIVLIVVTIILVIFCFYMFHKQNINQVKKAAFEIEDIKNPDFYDEIYDNQQPFEEERK